MRPVLVLLSVLAMSAHGATAHDGTTLPGAGTPVLQLDSAGTPPVSTWCLGNWTNNTVGFLDSHYTCYVRRNDVMVESLRISHDGVIRYNNAYSWPSSDGAAGQVPVTDGSGTISWVGPCAGETRFGSSNTVATGGGTNVAPIQRNASGILGLSTNDYETKTISVPTGWFFALSQTTGSGMTVISAFDQSMGN